MSTSLTKVRWILFGVIILVVAVLAATGGSWLGTASAQTVPTIPTLTPVPHGGGGGRGGSDKGTIILCVAGAPKDAWVVVQWKDLKGGWHDVETWSGRLDAESTTFYPGKVCVIRWVNRQNFGEKPFRWLVYSKRGEGVWRPSSEFAFPVSAGQWVWAELLPASAPGSWPDSNATVGSAGPTPLSGVIQGNPNLVKVADFKTTPALGGDLPQPPAGWQRLSDGLAVRGWDAKSNDIVYFWEGYNLCFQLPSDKSGYKQLAIAYFEPAANVNRWVWLKTQVNGNQACTYRFHLPATLALFGQ